MNNFFFIALYKIIPILKALRGSLMPFKMNENYLRVMLNMKATIPTCQDR